MPLTERWHGMTLSRRLLLSSTVGAVAFRSTTSIGLAAVAPTVPSPSHIGKPAPSAAPPPAGYPELTLSTTGLSSKTVSLAFDMSPSSPAERVALLGRLLEQSPQPAGWYLQEGAVSVLEQMAAAMFGKEDAVFMPTGTLANNIAVRLLCGVDSRRVLVQAGSHIYQREGDAPQTLSGLNLVALAADKVSPSPEEISAAIDASELGYEPTKIGAISLESPVHSMRGASVPFSTLQRISKIARERNIGMHWDGARALLLTSVPGFDLKATAALFDTVYMSLYKYLDAPFGAVLMGTKKMIDRARSMRHTFGGLIFTGWQTALPVLHTLPTFQQNYLQAYGRFTRLLAGLQNTRGFDVERVPEGTNVAFVRISSDRLRGLTERLAAADIFALKPVDGLMPLYANLSILRRSPEELLALFTGG
jgi:threonine aldolase